MKRVPSKQCNATIHRDRDGRALFRLALLLFCALILASGFVFAARQHFAAVQYGYSSEALRLERIKLMEEQQYLLLKKQQAYDPARLQSQGIGLGLKPLLASQMGTKKASRLSQSPLAPALVNPAASFQRSSAGN